MREASADNGPFFLFAGDLHYPSRFLGDYQGAYASIEEARNHWWSHEWAAIATVRGGELVVVEEREEE